MRFLAKFAIALVGWNFLPPAEAPAATPIVASSLTIPLLLQTCEGARTDLTANFCTGYIMGTFDALSFARKICPPDNGVDTLQAVSFTRKYLSDHPEEWGKAPGILVASALKQLFPCAHP